MVYVHAGKSYCAGQDGKFVLAHFICNFGLGAGKGWTSGVRRQP